ncbi:Probable peroxisomal acyl-coenzyme A oxidase 1 [Gryllus bimaculatus]|nr:Probable peroxisomal acyl-coenzyme A oxidase 1 [Gryllus bimaculatus]
MSLRKVNEDLARERRNCTFDPTELTYLLDGGEEKTKERRDREKFFLSDPNLKDTVPAEYLSHKEKYENAVKKACYLFTKVKQMQGEGSAMEGYRQVLGGTLGSAILKDGNPFTLHYVMFIPTIMGQGNYEQQIHWIGRAWNLDMIGTYAQTELGHGTFVRGLETTAHYDPRTQEFIINSPTLTSYKWWPVGHTANYAVVVAQLHTQGKSHGIHPFIVQIRDEKSVKVGEIGTKLGMNATNNGYLGFDHVRIPRENMLMKNAQVLEDGTYVKSPRDKLAYGTMVFVRVVLIQDVASYLCKAVTIATRYSAVRRQSELKPGQPEPQIIEYKTQQFKLLPNIAACFAFKFSAAWLWDMYNNVAEELDEKNFEHLPELHAISCCLKAVCTADGTAGVETCRLACGGHGYMTCSNLPSTYGLITATCTYEAWEQVSRGEPLTPTVSYLKTAGIKTDEKWENTLGHVIKAFKQVAAGKIRTSAQNMDRRVRNGYSQEDAWNMTSIELAHCSEAHCRAFIVEKFVESVEALTVSPPLRAVLTQLCELYAVYWLLKKSGDFLQYSFITPEDIEGIQLWLEILLERLRPNAVGIVDGFDLCDEILSSALGAWDGQVYERLFEEALKSPLNSIPVNSSFHKYMKPFFKSSL